MKNPSEMTPEEVQDLVAYTSPTANLTLYYSDIKSITYTHVVLSNTSYKVLPDTRLEILEGKANFELYSMTHASVDVDALLTQKMEDLTAKALLKYIQPSLDVLDASSASVGASVANIDVNTQALSNAVDNITEIDTHAINSRTKDIVKSIVKLEGKFKGVIDDLKTLYPED